MSTTQISTHDQTRAEHKASRVRYLPCIHPVGAVRVHRPALNAETCRDRSARGLGGDRAPVAAQRPPEAARTRSDPRVRRIHLRCLQRRCRHRRMGRPLRPRDRSGTPLTDRVRLAAVRPVHRAVRPRIGAAAVLVRTTLQANQPPAHDDVGARVRRRWSPRM